MDWLVDPIIDYVQPLWPWLEANLLTTAAVEQIVIGLVALFLSGLCARAVRREQIAGGTASLHHHPILLRLRLSQYKAVLYIATTALLWLAVGFSRLAEWPHGLLYIFASLALAGCIIRFGAGLIRNALWSRIVALCVWLAAALEIIGLLRPLLALLGSIGLNVGRQRYSLLLMLKGFLAFGLLLWAGSLLNDITGRALQRSNSVTPSQKVMLLKVMRIITVLLAMLVALNAAGLDLTVLAVFGGAVGIGAGIGLQRIFANLVSGFVLLMDKSIKPGDVITVMDTYGWVNRLGGRYVSILTRDGKEHLIPNEKLITEPVVNWSYTDDKVRLHIPVTVSYKADVYKVKEILLQAAAHDPRILASPKPVCLLFEFGESGIKFDVRVWIRDPVNGVANVRSSFYFAVWDKFREHGIEFPYPQRDIHIKTDQTQLPLMQDIKE